MLFFVKWRLSRHFKYKLSCNMQLMVGSLNEKKQWRVKLVSHLWVQYDLVIRLYLDCSYCMNSKSRLSLKLLCVELSWWVSELWLLCWTLSGCVLFVSWPCFGLCFRQHESSWFGSRNEWSPAGVGSERRQGNERPQTATWRSWNNDERRAAYAILKQRQSEKWNRQWHWYFKN